MAGMPPFEVRTVNPRKGKGKKSMKKKSRRRRKKNPTANPASNPAPRRRRSSSGRRRRGHSRRSNPRRRRSNPGWMAGGWPYGYGPDQWLWYGIGHVMSAFLVRRFGDTWGKGVMGNNLASPYAGQAWTFKNYLISVIGGYLGASLVKRWKGDKAAENVWRASVDNGIVRLVWTELFGRSKWAQDTFGMVPVNTGYGNLVQAGPLGNLVPAGPLGYAPGTVIDDGAGNRYAVNEYGQYVPMMGYGNDYETIPMGHLIDVETADKSFDIRARYLNRGATDPYSAVYQSAA